MDSDFGLPVAGNEYVKNPQPRFPVDGISYEAYDPQAGRPLEGVFVAGWSRKASTGLVGIARRDGINGAKAVAQYLQTLPPLAADPEEIVRAICERIRCREKPAVSLADLALLEAAERREAEARGLVEFKFENNEEMLRAMGLRCRLPNPLPPHPFGCAEERPGAGRGKPKVKSVPTAPASSGRRWRLYRFPRSPYYSAMAPVSAGRRWY